MKKLGKVIGYQSGNEYWLPLDIIVEIKIPSCCGKATVLVYYSKEIHSYECSIESAKKLIKQMNKDK